MNNKEIVFFLFLQCTIKFGHKAHSFKLLKANFVCFFFKFHNFWYQYFTKTLIIISSHLKSRFITCPKKNITITPLHNSFNFHVVKLKLTLKFITFTIFLTMFFFSCVFTGIYPNFVVPCYSNKFSIVLY